MNSLFKVWVNLIVPNLRHGGRQKKLLLRVVDQLVDSGVQGWAQNRGAGVAKQREQGGRKQNGHQHSPGKRVFQDQSNWELPAIVPQPPQQGAHLDPRQSLQPGRPVRQEHHWAQTALVQTGNQQFGHLLQRQTAHLPLFHLDARSRPAKSRHQNTLFDLVFEQVPQQDSQGAGSIQ